MQPTVDCSTELLVVIFAISIDKGKCDHGCHVAYYRDYKTYHICFFYQFYRSHYYKRISTIKKPHEEKYVEK